MTTHKIQWLNLPGYKGETWNPVVGCNKVSDGCKNCYAEKMAFRVAYMTGVKYTSVLKQKPDENGLYFLSPEWNGKTEIYEPDLTKPAAWKAPRVVFVCSMGDLFHETVSFETISAIFSVMADCDRHIFIVLTKRPERMFDFYQWKSGQQQVPWQPSDNVWIGVTAEDQGTALDRIKWLNLIYAAVKFVSIEPMLSAINFEVALGGTLKWHAGGLKNCLSWVICGGESGNNARPVHPDWVRSVRDQCQAVGVPFFFKQWGEWKPEGTIKNYNFLNPKREVTAGIDVMVKVGKHRSGNVLDGRKWEEYPEVGR